MGMSIGTRIREARKRAKLTQEQLAARVGMKQATLSQLETGGSARTSMIGTLAQALGVSALWLETGKGAQESALELPASQDRTARMILAYADEEDLLDLFRRADERGKFEIIKFARREAGRGPESVV